MTNLGLSPETVRALKDRGIEALFAIQKAVFLPASEGRDLIGRAKTGSGKTLAFGEAACSRQAGWVRRPIVGYKFLHLTGTAGCSLIFMMADTYSAAYMWES